MCCSVAVCGTRGILVAWAVVGNARTVRSCTWVSFICIRYGVVDALRLLLRAGPGNRPFLSCPGREKGVHSTVPGPAGPPPLPAPARGFCTGLSSINFVLIEQ